MFLPGKSRIFKVSLYLVSALDIKRTNTLKVNTRTHHPTKENGKVLRAKGSARLEL